MADREELLKRREELLKRRERLLAERRGEDSTGKRFLDFNKRLGGSALLGALKVLDAPRAGVAKLNELPGPTELALGPVGVMARGEEVRKLLPKKGVAGFLGNTAVDIAQDPLTYMTFGTTGAAKAGLKVVGKELGEQAAKDVVERGARKALDQTARQRLVQAVATQEGGSAKAGEKLLKALDKGGQGGVKIAGRTVVAGKRFAPVTKAGRAVVTNKRLDPLAKVGRATRKALVPRAEVSTGFGREVADSIGAASARARAQASHGTAQTVKNLERTARKAKVTEDELKTVVLPALDVGGAAVNVPTRLQPLVKALAESRDDLTQRLADEGLLKTARDDYIPRYYTEAGHKALGHPSGALERAGVPATEMGAALREGGHRQPRKLMPDAALADVESTIGGQLRQAGKLGADEDLLERNPLVAFGRRAAFGERAIAYKRMVDDVQNVVTPDGEHILVKATPKTKRPAGFEEFDLPGLGKFWAPLEIRDEIMNVRKVITNDDALREFQGLMGRLNTLWKGYATVPIVGGFGFHARNATGNVWNNFLAGVRNPADYARAARIQRAAAAGRKLSPDDAEVLRLAEKHGILNDGFFLTELINPKNKGGRLGRAAVDQRGARVAAAVNPLSTENLVIRSGRAVGSAVEGNARMAHFIAKLDELGSADEAARSVRKYLFDYGDITETERSIKRYVAFWTFMRKNLPVQLGSLAHQPGKFSALAHAQRAGWAGREQSDYPEWAVAEGMVPTSDDFMVGADVPAFAAFETFEPTEKNLIGRFGGIGPAVAKFLAEEAAGKSLFTGGNLKGSKGRRLAQATFPLVGKVERAPYTAAATGDPQAPARLLTALTGLSARKVTAEDKKRTLKAKR